MTESFTDNIPNVTCGLIPVRVCLSHISGGQLADGEAGGGLEVGVRGGVLRLPG